MMLKMVFNQVWVGEIMECVSTVSFSVLVNGVKMDEFRPTRGIRQGDPISPYLFLLAADGLSCLLRARSTNENVRGVVVAPNAPPG